VLNDTRYHPGSEDSFLFALTASNKASAGNGATRSTLLWFRWTARGPVMHRTHTPAHTSRRLSASGRDLSFSPSSHLLVGYS